MPDKATPLSPAWRRCRMVAAALIAALWPGRDDREVEARLRALPKRQQVWAVGGVLGLLFLCALFAAQFGPVGLALYLLAVIALMA